jgi:hypothetical protein
MVMKAAEDRPHTKPVKFKTRQQLTWCGAHYPDLPIKNIDPVANGWRLRARHKGGAGLRGTRSKPPGQQRA